MSDLMSTQTQLYVHPAETTLRLVPHTCGNCGVVFGMESGYMADRKRDRRTFYCPNGCCRVFTGPTREQLLEKQLESARSYSRHLEDQRAAAERSASAYKGQVTKVKRRVGNGVCPCCNRTFVNLARHMGSQHPDFKDEPSLDGGA
jgi:hypothetical protein